MSEPEQKTGEKAEQPPAPARPSPVLPQLLVVFVVLGFVAFNGKDSWWGIIPQVPMLAYLAAATWASLSRKDFEEDARKYNPGRSRIRYCMHSLFFFVAIPGLVWLFLALPALHHWITHYLFAIGTAAGAS